MMVAPTRSGGTSASAVASGPNSVVPSTGVPPSLPPASTVRTSTPRNCASRCFSVASASAVILSRLSRPWLALLSTTRATTVDSGSRSSLSSTGLARAATRASAARARSQPPRIRRQRPGRTSNAAITAMAISSGSGRSGAKERDQFTTLLPQPLEQRGHVHLVGLVVAGQRVHDDVDARAVGHLALRGIAGDRRIEEGVAGVDGPGAGEIVLGDQD